MTIDPDTFPVSSNRAHGVRRSRSDRARAALIVAGALWLAAATVGWGASAAEAQKAPRVPVLTRHSGVIRLHSWSKGFQHEKWVRSDLKRALVGEGDWIQLGGSGAQADIVFPDLTTFLMRKAAEVQILKVGGKEHEIALMSGISFDIALRKIPTRIRLPGGVSIRGLSADLIIMFERTYRRIRVRHARGTALQVFRGNKIVRTLESGSTLDFDLPEATESTEGVEQELSKTFVFRALDRRIEIPPGVLYSIEGRTISLRRDAIYGDRFGVVRIDDEVVVVGPGSTAELTIPE